MSGDSESVDDERDAISPTPPAEGTSESAYVEQVLRSFGSSFALAALEFLSEIAESSLEMTPEQLRALEQIVDRAMGEARERLCCSGNSNAKELHQERGDECHALVKIFEKLLAPMHQICVHSSVADVIGPPLIELLQVGFLKVLYAQYMSTQAYCSTKNSEVVGTLRHCICSRFVGGQQVDTGENSESVASNLSDTDLDDVQSAADVFDALVSDQERVSVLRPDVPQWFDEDDSEGSDSEQEAGVPLQTDVDENGSSQVECLASTTTVPQWFEDVDDEEEPDVDLLQCASENSNSLPEALGLATQWERDTCAVDRVVGTDETSKHQH
ncbi:hypothetical protein PC112_g18819 [Phytophthora cactorum]|nr:hypothetical protein PC112_g18819 [Phytophthora cactorum]